jgi:hypothetical protein
MKLSIGLAMMAVLGLVAACSGGETTPAGGRAKETAPTEKAPSTSDPAPAAPSGSTDGTPTNDASTPGEIPPQAVCVDECAASNPEGAKDFGSILLPCACAADVCGDVCSGCATATTAKDLLGAPEDACRTCVRESLGNGQACNTKLRAECPKKASCPGFAICAQSCQ